MTTVEVLVDDAGDTRLVGQAHFTRTRGQISTTFLYEPDYLAGDGTSIDPALPLVSGAQHQAGLVRAFSDSAPTAGAATSSRRRSGAAPATRAARRAGWTTSTSSWASARTRGRARGLLRPEFTVYGHEGEHCKRCEAPYRR